MAFGVTGSGWAGVGCAGAGTGAFATGGLAGAGLEGVIPFWTGFTLFSICRLMSSAICG